MLAHKLTAYRGSRDLDYAVNYLKQIKPVDKVAIFSKVKTFKPFVPHIVDSVFEPRFNQIWDKTFGKSR